MKSKIYCGAVVLVLSLSLACSDDDKVSNNGGQTNTNTSNTQTTQTTTNPGTGTQGTSTSAGGKDMGSSTSDKDMNTTSTEEDMAMSGEDMAGTGQDMATAGQDMATGDKDMATAGQDMAGNAQLPDVFAGTRVSMCSAASTNDCTSNADCAADERCEDISDDARMEVACCVKGARGPKATGTVCQELENKIECEESLCVARNDGPAYCTKRCTDSNQCDDPISECQSFLGLCVQPR